MRGVYAAVAVVLSTVSVAVGFDGGGGGGVDGRVSVAQINVPVARQDKSIDHLRLQFQVKQSTQPCSPHSLQINGQALARDEHGSGSGDISLQDGGGVVTASWGYKCAGEGQDGQTTALRISAVDGEDVDGGVYVRWSAVYPVGILEVHRPILMSMLHAVSGTKTKEEEIRQDAINMHSHDSQDDATKPTGPQPLHTAVKSEHLPAGRQSVLLQSCRGLDCGSGDGVAESEAPLELEFELEKRQPVHQGHEPRAGKQSSNDSSRRQTPLIIALVLSAILIIIVAFLSIRLLILRRRSNTQNTILPVSHPAIPPFEAPVRSFIPDHHHYDYNPYGQRRVRHEPRNKAVVETCRRAITAVFGNTTTKNSSASERSETFEQFEQFEKSAEAEKKHLQELERKSSPPPQEPETTMEEELAGFREAARMVDDLVAAEEGRRGRPRPPTIPPRVHPRHRSDSDVPAYTPYAYNEDTPPAYEDHVIAPPAATSGLRYHRGPASRDHAGESPAYREEEEK